LKQGKQTTVFCKLTHQKLTEDQVDTFALQRVLDGEERRHHAEVAPDQRGVVLLDLYKDTRKLTSPKFEVPETAHQQHQSLENDLKKANQQCQFHVN